MHIMLFPQKINTSAKGPKCAEMRQQTWHKWMDEFVCYLCFCWELFIQRTPLCKLYITEELSSRNWYFKHECGSRQRRSWSQSTSFVSEMSHILAYQQMLYAQNISFRNKCDFFATEARIYFKGVLITFHFVLFWGWGVRLDFL